MAQYVNKIDNTENVVSANIVSSATVVQNAAKVYSATSTTYTYEKDKLLIEGAAYVLVLSQKEFDALALKRQDTFYFILDPDFSPVISVEGLCDTSLFEAAALAIIGEAD